MGRRPKASKKGSTRGPQKRARLETDDKQEQHEQNEGKLNPLDIPKIVSIVVGYIDKVDDLKSTRKLNTTWRKETFQKWRNSAVFLINKETLPVLLAAFDERGLQGLSEKRMAAALRKRDSFLLKQFPFKKYRFTREQDWTYPLKENELEKKLIWEKVISPNATYLDVGNCSLRLCGGIQDSFAMQWMLKQLPNLTDFAIAPVISKEKYILNYVPSGPFHIYNFPDVTSLAISTQSGQYEMPVFMEDHNELNHQTAFFLLGRMLPNLKKLKLPSEGGLSSIIQAMIRSATYPGDRRVQIESLTAFTTKNPISSKDFREYVQRAKPPLKDLRMTVYVKEIDLRLRSSLRMLKNTLTKLELEVKYVYTGYVQLYREDFLFGDHDPAVPVNLTHFKVLLDYKVFTGKLLQFNLNNLKQMRKLREFHFGIKNKGVERDWVTRKVGFQDPEAETEEDNSDDDGILPDLKSFHFHGGNLTKDTVSQLGKMAKNLQTLELVFDKENFAGINKVWPRLQNLKLLPCSAAQRPQLSALKASNPTWNIVNLSKKYRPSL